MNKWKQADIAVCDQHGYLIAECANGGRAEQIVREHNSHAALLEACNTACRILSRDGIRSLMGEAFTQTEVEQIVSAVALAEPTP